MEVLTSPSSFGQISTEPLDMLIEKGYSVINNPFGRKLTEDEVITLAKDCVGIVAGLEPLNKKVMDALTQLRVISRVGIGMDNVDLEYALSKGIKVVNSPDAPTRSVAELTLSMTLSLLRKIPQADAALKKRLWKKQTGNLLHNKIIGVVGLGRIGKLVSEFFRALGNPVIAFDIFPNQAWCAEKGVEICDLNSLLAKADIVTLHVPGNKDKTPVIGAEQIALMKTGAFLINIARGEVVNETALYDALKCNKLAGAAVDAFSFEPYTGPLCDLDNIVLTPHIGSYAEEAKLQMEIDAVNNLLNELK